MGHALTAEHAAVLMAGLPVVWTAGLIWLRIVQLARLANGDARVFEARRSPPEAEAIGAACGLIRLDWGACFQIRGLTIQTRGRPVIRCPRCTRPAWRLHARQGRWFCWRCEDTGCIRTEILLGDYACGLRIGLHGDAMRNRRKFLLNRLRVRHLLRGKTPKDMLMLGIGGPLLRSLPTWERKRGFGPGMGQPGPVWQRLAPTILPASVEQLLHPDAYLHRFGRGT